MLNPPDAHAPTITLRRLFDLSLLLDLDFGQGSSACTTRPVASCGIAPVGRALSRSTSNSWRRSTASRARRGRGARSHWQNLRLISSICARDARQLPQQLVGRLGSFEAIGESGFIDRARRLLPRSSIVPLRPTLTPPRRRSAGGTEAEKIHAEMRTNDPRWRA